MLEAIAEGKRRTRTCCDMQFLKRRKPSVRRKEERGEKSCEKCHRHGVHAFNMLRAPRKPQAPSVNVQFQGLVAFIFTLRYHMGTRTDTDGRRNKKKKIFKHFLNSRKRKFYFEIHVEWEKRKKKGIAFFYDSAADWSDIEWVRYAQPGDPPQREMRG